MTRARQLAILVALVLASGAMAASAQRVGSLGFYGGIAFRDNGAQQGVAIGDAGNAARFAPVLGDVRAEHALVFGGYRWRNDLALEAAVASQAGYRLAGRGGVGLMLPGQSEHAARTWNLDLYGSWSFWRNFSLYGRLGYAQAEAAPLYSTSIAASPSERRRDGLNYGVGLRYDVTRSLGLKLEYAHVGAHAAETSVTGLPEADQVQFGVQFRF